MILESLAQLNSQATKSRDARPVVIDARVVTESGGGPDKTILNSPRFLAKSYRNLCLYLHPPGDAGFESIRAKARLWDAPLLAVPDRGPFDWRVIAECLAICRRERARIWHGHDYKTNALGLLLARFWPMKLITTVHGWVKHTARTPLYYRVDRWCLPRYEKVVCVSSDLVEACEKSGVNPEKCVLMENGIDLDMYQRRYSSAKAKGQLKVPPERLLIGAVGRLSDEKGFDLLIRAVDRLLKEGCDVELWIAGGGDQEGPLCQLIRSLNCSDRIKMLGFQADLMPLYHAMDLFVLSSLREGLPNVVLEAMALEVPVIATRVAGIPRLIQHGENGILIEPGSVDQLYEAIHRLLTAEELRKSLSRKARATVAANHSFAARMSKMMQLYDELLS